MELSKMIKKQEPAQKETPADGQCLSKEEYAAMKKAEREDLWARVDAQAQAVFQDDAAMKNFLDFMARCTPQSTRNLLILYEQNPEITHPRTFDMWLEAGRSVRNGESGYTFFTESKYQREDGTTGRGYDIVKAFDISQTRGPQVYPAQPHLPDEVIAAMIENSPVPLALSDQLPKGVQAQYVPKQRTIYVRNGMDESATLCAIAREQAHATFDVAGSGYRRQAYAAQSYCAAYVVAQKFGLDTSGFKFDKVCQAWADKDPQEQRSFLSDVKRAAYSINREVQRSFRDMDQVIQPDEFEVGKAARAKSEKAEKAPESR